MTVVLPKQQLCVLNCYRPPGNDIKVFIDELQKLILWCKSSYRKYDFLLGGDFNINLNNPRHEHTLTLNEAMQQGGLVSLIYSPTRITEHSSTTIDLIYSSRSDHVGTIIVTDISDHQGVACEIVDNDPKPKPHKKRRKMNTSNINNLIDVLNDTSWERVYSSVKPCKEFYKLLQAALDRECPKSTPKIDKNRTPVKSWMNANLLQERRTKFALHRRFLETKNAQNKEDYLIQRRRYNQLVREAKRNDLDLKLSSNVGNSRLIWSTVNAFLNRPTKGSTDIKSIKTKDGKTTDKKLIAK